MENDRIHIMVLNFAADVGKLMLKSGAEISRVEDTMSRILLSHHYSTVDTFVIPTGIMVTIDNPDFTMCTKVCRVKDRGARLDQIELLNQLSRDYVSRKLTLEEAISKLKEIEQIHSYSPLTLIITTGFAVSFLSVMFGGGLWDFFSSFFIGLLEELLRYRLSKKNIINYIVLFLCSFFIGATASLLSSLFQGVLHSDSIIIAAITPLLPGVAFTNSIRDVIGDELLSGISRGVEALLIAVSIASGIGISLAMHISLGGLL